MSERAVEAKPRATATILKLMSETMSSFSDDEELVLEALRRSNNSLAEASEIAGKIAETSVTIPVQADEEEQLFGSVTNVEIANALSEDGFDIERRKISLEAPIKKLGVYEADIKLHKEVTAKLKVWVVKA